MNEPIIERTELAKGQILRQFGEISHKEAASPRITADTRRDWNWLAAIRRLGQLRL